MSRCPLLTVTIALALAAAASVAAPAHARMKGDLSCGVDDPQAPCYPDDRVDAADVLILARHLSGLYGQAFTAEQTAAADVAPAATGGDGLVNAADLLALSRAALLGVDADADGSPLEPFSSPFLPDTDGDGLCDGANVVLDGICSGGEAALGTNPLKVDSDGDGLCDGPNQGQQTGPFGETCIFGEDLNGNGIIVMSTSGPTETDPTRADTDLDGIGDFVEDGNQNGTRETFETSAVTADTDEDSLCEGPFDRVYTSQGLLVCATNEGRLGLNPRLADSDGNGLTDLQEQTVNVECPGCFAVFVMPDTQGYARSGNNDKPMVSGANHLLRFADYICANNGSTPEVRWREPVTGKLMPIKMVIQLGDLTQANSDQEWQAMSALFDELDECSVPYVVVPGNHDMPDIGGTPNDFIPSYAGPTAEFNKYFAAPCVPAGPGEDPKACETPGNPYYQHPSNPAAFPPRAGWSAPNLCDDPPNCAPPGPGLPNGEWFLGNGDDIPADSRNDFPPNQPDEPLGPEDREPGRHRSAVLHTPDGRKMLFLGLELGFDITDLAAPLDLLAAFPNSPAILFHHSAFLQNASEPGPFSSQRWDSDELGHAIPYGQDILDRLLAPDPEQIIMTLNGHTGVTATKTYTAAGSSHSVWRLLRNYQGIMQEGATGGIWGAGWNVIMAFDPALGKIRVRSYRIADDANYRTQWLFDRGFLGENQVDLRGEGVVEDTRILDKDRGEAFGGFTLDYDPGPP